MFVYKDLLDNNVPFATQPEKIKIQLKPHQLAGLQRAITMEQNERFMYSDRCHTTTYVRTSIGVIGEKVGYGKTITALSIIASSNVDDIYVSSKNIKCHMNGMRKNGDLATNIMTIEHIDNNFEDKLPKYIKCTLVVVPRGPVFTQWDTAIKEQTSLKHLSIFNVRDIKRLIDMVKTEGIDYVKEYIENHDIVLIKNTALKQMFSAFIEIRKDVIYNWARVIIDEAHDTSSSLPYLNYKFMWFISATYHKLQYRNFVPLSMANIKDCLYYEMKYVLIKSCTNFIENSFILPEKKELYYKCYLSEKLNAVRNFLTKSVLDRINASDIEGAVREMGGKDLNENSIIDILTENLKRDLHNRNREKEYVLSLDIGETEKKNRITGIDNSIKVLESQIECIKERLKMHDKQCAICIDTISEPIVLNCSHSFCGECIFTWLKRKKFCPECKMEIDSTCVMRLNNSAMDESIQNKNRKRKEEVMLDIIKEKPDGKFLIFSKIENGFSNITKCLNANNISHTEIKGNTNCMNNILGRFKNGDLNVILLNTHHAGSGIDISCATDVIIYHGMKEEKIQAVGRAYRVGRKEPLTIHNLLHENEM
jgi:SNF2 family DNA or RNA helicase